MAITIAAISGFEMNLGPGLKVKGLKITMDGSYTGSGGEACDLSDHFPNKCFGMALVGDDDGWLLRYEPAATYGTASGKIMSRNVISTLDKALIPETTAATSLSTVSALFVGFGN